MLKFYSKVTLLLLLFLPLGNNLFAKDISLAELLPENVSFFVSSSSLSNFIKDLNFIVDRILPRNERYNFLSKINSIEQNIGINFLNLSSLSSIGFDTRGKVAFSLDETTSDMILFLPVNNFRTFPWKFTQYLNKLSSKNKKVSFYPVITKYKECTVYQIGKDIFATGIEGFFVLSNRGNLIHKIIDNNLYPEKILIRNKNFIKYLQNRKHRDINIFANENFIKKIVKIFYKKFNVKNKKKNLLNPNSFILSKLNPKIPSKSIKRKKNTTAKTNISANNKKIIGLLTNEIDFVSIGLFFDEATLNWDSNIYYKKKQFKKIVKVFPEMQNSGVSVNSIDVKNFDSVLQIVNPIFNKNRKKNLYLSDFIVSLLEITFPINNKIFSKIKNKFSKNYNGIFNVYYLDKKKDHWGFFFSMKNYLSSKLILKDMRKILKNRLKKKKYKTGTFFINRKKAFFIKTKSYEYILLADKHGIYFGNGKEILTPMLNVKNISKKGVKESTKKIFMVGFVKNWKVNNSIFKLENKNMAQILNKIKEMIFYGIKNDESLNFLFKIDFK